MDIETLVSTIGKEFGVTLALNENLVASLVIDEKFDLEFEYVDDMDTLFVSSPLGKLTGSGNGPVFKALLDANLYGKGTGGAVFAIDDRTDEIILFFKTEVAKTEYEEFRDILERYLNTRTQWITNFERIINESANNGSEDGDLLEVNLNHALRI